MLEVDLRLAICDLRLRSVWNSSECRKPNAERRIHYGGLSLMLALLFLGRAQGAITVNGLTTRTVYTDQVAFHVVAEAGFTYEATLNGAPVPAGVQVTVSDADFYDLEVTRRPSGGGAAESLTLLFIVKASERADTEWGLAPWTPYPSIPSATAEFAGASLVIVAPPAFPVGPEIPVIALVEDGAGKRVGVNGFVTAAALPGKSIRIFRGVGSALLPPAAAGGTLSFAAQIGPLSNPREIAIEAAPAWRSVSGSLAASTDWGADARIRVTASLTVAAGATLTIGAGSVVELGSKVDLIVSGKLVVNGTRDRPVVFTPIASASPWGGLQFRTAGSQGALTGAIFTGGGADPSWFDNNPGTGSSHHHEQPILYLQNGAHVSATDSYLVWNHGQGGHGEDSFVSLTRCLVQRATTFGQYNGGSVTLTDSAFIEFPAWDAPFVDGDNDAMYLSRVGTGLAHSLTGCLVGWTLDDGVDCGGGGTGPVNITGSWFESTYHEGNACSDNGLRALKDNVYTNCGQGIECGYGSETAQAVHCLSTANEIGARFGDNYQDMAHNGFLRVTDSILLANKRDIWGRAWDPLPHTWEERLTQMDLHSNFLTAADPLHADNSVWDPAVDADRLAPFLPVPDGTVGIGIAVRSDPVDRAALKFGVPVRLSTFTRQTVSVDYQFLAGGGPPGTLVFSAGETLKVIPLDAAALNAPLIRVRLSNPVNAELTGLAEISSTIPVTLVARGSRWKYLDTGVPQGAGWITESFLDTAWKEGPAELGYGDQDEQTPVSFGPDANNKYITTYFRHKFTVADPSAYAGLTIRLKRDDGGVVYLNGQEAFRSNMPGGAIGFSTLAGGATGSETAFNPKDVAASFLVAGSNIIAVEIHQDAPDSSDISFDLELLAQPRPSTGPRFVRGEANGDGAVDLSDALKVLFVLFTGAPTDCEDALDADDQGDLNVVDAVYLLEYLFQGGPAPPAPFPAAGEDPTGDDLGCERS